jgi:hypothetical protein
MHRAVGWLPGGVRVDSVLVIDGAGLRHIYQLIGGQDHGRVFASLNELAVYADDFHQGGNQAVGWTAPRPLR